MPNQFLFLFPAVCVKAVSNNMIITTGKHLCELMTRNLTLTKTKSKECLCIKQIVKLEFVLIVNNTLFVMEVLTQTRKIVCLLVTLVGIGAVTLSTQPGFEARITQNGLNFCKQALYIELMLFKYIIRYHYEQHDKETDNECTQLIECRV